MGAPGHVKFKATTTGSLFRAQLSVRRSRQTRPGSRIITRVTASHAVSEGRTSAVFQYNSTHLLARSPFFYKGAVFNICRADHLGSIGGVRFTLATRKRLPKPQSPESAVGPGDHTLLVATTRERDARPGTLFNGERASSLDYAAVTVSIPPTMSRAKSNGHQCSPAIRTSTVVRDAAYLDGDSEFVRALNASIGGASARKS